jgi:beta-1,4-mannosyl-glycoprotein beta-1,4-N-acetylglucosaminyltransferase
MKIIDAFVFYNELEMLNYRLETLSPHVDYFVLVEATYTHNGLPKPLHFNENKSRFSKFLHKIVHVVVDDFPHKEKVDDGRQWVNEAFQREKGISRGLRLVPGVDLNDYAVCSDLDEIVNPDLIRDIRSGKMSSLCDYHALEMDFYYYNLNSKLDHKWYHSKVITYKKYISLGWELDEIRLNMSFQTIPNGGWHLSYFGDGAFISNKIQNFGHQEFNTPEFTNTNSISNKIKKSIIQ